ncbi:MAG TPA: hypothetical protein VIL28_16475 [Steroidobacteraceae bacterium]
MNRIVIGTILLAGAALAAEETPLRPIERPLTREQQRFLALDTNGDRKLSLEEFRVDARSPTEFTELDTDGDGFLSMAEFTARPIPKSD